MQAAERGEMLETYFRDLISVREKIVQYSSNIPTRQRIKSKNKCSRGREIKEKALDTVRVFPKILPFVHRMAEREER